MFALPPSFLLPPLIGRSVFFFFSPFPLSSFCSWSQQRKRGKAAVFRRTKKRRETEFCGVIVWNEILLLYTFFPAKPPRLRKKKFYLPESANTIKFHTFMSLLTTFFLFRRIFLFSPGLHFCTFFRSHRKRRQQNPNFLFSAPPFPLLSWDICHKFGWGGLPHSLGHTRKKIETGQFLAL